jgi:ketosteroid isomerase-like protein
MRQLLSRLKERGWLSTIKRGDDMDTYQTAQAAYSTAMRNGDLDALLSLAAPGAVVWHNNDAQDVPWEQTVQTIGWLHRAMPDISWEDVALWWTPEGFIWQVILRASTPGGSIDAHLCMIVRVTADGLISRLEEYVDPAAFAPLTRQGASVTAPDDSA